jgi:alpha 1,2-mannosyltransferase
MTSEKLALGAQKRHFTWRKILVFLLTLVILHRLILILFTHRSRPHLVETEITKLGYNHLYQSSWHNLAGALQESRPKIKSIGHLTPVKGIPVDSIKAPTDITALETKPSDVQSLRKSHKAFTNRIEDHTLNVVYQAGHAGIVITAGADDLPAVLVQIRLLRRTGSKLPVQVFLISLDDFDSEICKKQFSKLNAECKILEEYTDTSPIPKMPQSTLERRVRANEPLHKLLAIFFSRFEEVVLLDPTTLVYNNPDMLTREEPYLTTGLIMWPDFWASTVSEKIHAVQNAGVLKQNSRDKLRTVDMGQFLISKSMHSNTLLLSIYYTYFGENLYDSLLMQSKSGEKGSQSIKTAAQYFDAPYYMIKRYVEAVGFPDMDKEDKGFHGVAMQQPFPSDDYHRFSNERQRPLFVRANNPKLHAAHIMKQGVTSFKGDGAGSPVAHRMWEWFDGRHASNGWRDPDPERAAWEEIWRIACVDAKHFSIWPQNQEETRSNCEAITKHREALGWKDFFVL